MATPPRLILPPDGMPWGRWVQDETIQSQQDRSRLRSEANNNQKATAATIAKLQQQVVDLATAQVELSSVQEELGSMRTYSIRDNGTSPTYNLTPTGITSGFLVTLDIPRPKDFGVIYKILVTVGVNYALSVGAAPTVAVGGYGGITLDMHYGPISTDVRAYASLGLRAAPMTDSTAFSQSDSEGALVATGILEFGNFGDPIVTLASRVNGNGNHNGSTAFASVILQQIYMTASIIEIVQP